MTQEEYKKDIIKKTKALGLYKKEFEHTINGLARALADQEKTINLFDASGGHIMVKHTNKAGATNAAKNPFYLAIESLRVDILAYCRELGLTPASLKRIKEEELRKKKDSPLADALRKISNSA